jgi:hypothetical protein
MILLLNEFINPSITGLSKKPQGAILGVGGCEGAKDNPTPFYVAQESGGEKRLFIFCQAIDIYFLSV